jgi:outer membrane protein, heavy metal efflux system
VRRLFHIAVVVCLSRQGLAGDGTRPEVPTSPAWLEDATLRGLIAEALAGRPEIKQAQARISAMVARVPQQGILPDPTLSVGLQNEGVGEIQLGKSQGSWLFLVASQTLPWFGKRALRTDIAGFDKQDADVDLARVVLTAAADVERAYLDLQLARARLEVQGRMALLWKQAEAVARARYEAGEGTQADLLRVQLQESRLKQRRRSLESEEKRQIAVVNRLRGKPGGTPVPDGRNLVELPDPELPELEQAIRASVAASPELKKAELVGRQADRRVALASRERWPDVMVSAALMPRFGGYPTMWQAGLAFNVPLWTLEKQAKAADENRARGLAARNGAEALRHLIEQRVRERLELLRGLVESNHIYRSGLLIQSQTTVSSTLVQYQSGRVPFAQVLEALSGYLADVDGLLGSLAAAERIDIAQREISLEPPDGAVGMGKNGAGNGDE